MKIVKGICPSCKKFKMYVLIGKDTRVKCPRCHAESKVIKWLGEIQK